MHQTQSCPLLFNLLVLVSISPKDPQVFPSHFRVANADAPPKIVRGVASSISKLLMGLFFTDYGSDNGKEGECMKIKHLKHSDC